jgi:hypothetical protein
MDDINYTTDIYCTIEVHNIYDILLKINEPEIYVTISMKGTVSSSHKRTIAEAVLIIEAYVDDVLIPDWHLINAGTINYMKDTDLYYCWYVVTPKTLKAQLYAGLLS